LEVIVGPEPNWAVAIEAEIWNRTPKHQADQNLFMSMEMRHIALRDFCLQSQVVSTLPQFS